MFSKISAYIKTALLEEQERWLLWLPVAMGCGVFLYFRLEKEPSQYAGLAMLILTFPALWRWRRFPLLRAVLLAAFGLGLGFSAVQWQAKRVAAPVLEKPIRFTTLQGHLTQVIDTEDGMKLVIDNPVMQKNEYHTVLPKRIRLNLRKADDTLQAGQEIRLRAGLFPLPQPALPGGYDIARHFYFQGIGAVGYGLAPVEIVKEANLNGAEEWLNDLRHRFSRKIREEIPGAEGTIADALITGEQSAIPKEIREAMAVAGIAHILSVSGLHLSLVAGIMFAALRFLLVLLPGVALRYPVKKWSALGALLGSFSYLALSGFQVAANRSFVMVALVLCAVLLDRQVLSLRSVALAAILLLVWTPESLLGPSFQLSFAATAAIVALYEVYSCKPLSNRFHDWWLVRPWFYLAGIALTSLVAGMATTPYVILHFHQLTIYHILTNLLTAPILSLLVMPAGLLVVLGMAVGCAGPFLAVMQWGIGKIIIIAQWVADLPLAVSYVPSFPDWGIACFTFGALWLCCWRKRWRFAGIPLMVLGMLSLLTSPMPDVVVAPLGEQVAIRMEDGNYTMVKGGTRNFVAQIWQESLGVKEFVSPIKDKRLKCDSEGCIANINEHSLAVPATRIAAAEDCELSEITIADFYMDCPGNSLRFSRPKAALALWLRDEKPRVRKAQSYIERLPE